MSATARFVTAKEFEVELLPWGPHESPAKIAGPALVDVHKEEPWCALREFSSFPGL